MFITEKLDDKWCNYPVLCRQLLPIADKKCPGMRMLLKRERVGGNDHSFFLWIGYLNGSLRINRDEMIYCTSKYHSRVTSLKIEIKKKYIFNNYRIRAGLRTQCMRLWRTLWNLRVGIFGDTNWNPWAPFKAMVFQCSSPLQKQTRWFNPRLYF